MKKLIFLLLLAVLACTDQDLTQTMKNMPSTGTMRPNTCALYPGPESKVFSMTGNYTPPTLSYGESLTINWQSNDTFNPDAQICDYLLTIIVKNTSSKNVKYYKDGVYIGFLNAGASKTYTWSASGDDCLGPCPDQVSGSFYITVENAGGSQNSCATNIEIKLYTDAYNNPVISTASVVTYHFENNC